MTKDGPPQGGMRFGYRAARDAGVPFRNSPTAAQINLDRFVGRHPHLKGVADEMRAKGKLADTVLYDLRCEGHDGKFALCLWRDVERTRWIEERFGHDRSVLETEISWGLKHKVYGAGQLWELGEDGDWTEVACWPDELETEEQ